MAKTANLEDKKGCKVWEGCIKADGYGVMKVKFQDGKRKVKGVHQLAYICHYRTLCLPKDVEISHLCHVKNTVQIDHLVAEPHHINLS